MKNNYDHNVSDFEQSTAQKRKNLRKSEAERIEQESNEKVIQKLHIDKHAVTTVADIVEATDDHEEEIMDAFDQWKEDETA